MMNSLYSHPPGQGFYKVSNTRAQPLKPAFNKVNPQFGQGFSLPCGTSQVVIGGLLTAGSFTCMRSLQKFFAPQDRIKNTKDLLKMFGIGAALGLIIPELMRLTKLTPSVGHLFESLTVIDTDNLMKSTPKAAKAAFSKLPQHNKLTTKEERYQMGAVLKGFLNARLALENYPKADALRRYAVAEKLLGEVSSDQLLQYANDAEKAYKDTESRLRDKDAAKKLLINEAFPEGLWLTPVLKMQVEHEVEKALSVQKNYRDTYMRSFDDDLRFVRGESAEPSDDIYRTVI